MGAQVLRLDAASSKKIGTLLTTEAQNIVEMAKELREDLSTFFQWEDWSELDLRSCDLTGVSFHGANLDGVIVYADQLELIKATQPASIKGATLFDRPVDQAQMPNEVNDIAARRKELGWTQEELAYQAFGDRGRSTQVAAIEAGQHNDAADELSVGRIRAALGLDQPDKDENRRVISVPGMSRRPKPVKETTRDAAFELCRKAIRTAIGERSESLNVGTRKFMNLDRIPREISEATSLKNIVLHNTSVSSLEHLSFVVALETLDIYSTQVSDVAPLSELRFLRELFLEKTRVSSVEALKGNAKLEKLFLRDTLVRDVEPLSKLPKLKKLVLSGCNLDELSALEKMPMLTSLDLSEADIISAESFGRLRTVSELKLMGASNVDKIPLDRLTKVKSLDVSNTSFYDFSRLDQLESLRILNLSGTGIADLTAISGLSELKVLKISQCPVSDLGPILLLDNLEELHINETEVSTIAPLLQLSRLKKLVVSSGAVKDIKSFTSASGIDVVQI